MSSQLFFSLISSIAVGGVAGYLGSLMLQKKMALVAGPLGHLAFPGVALALLYGFDISLGAFPFIILGILFVWFLQSRTNISTEALTAIIFAVGVSTAIIFLPVEKAEEALAGNIMLIDSFNALLSVILSVIIFFVSKKIFSKMILLNISEDLAIVEGINPKKYNLLYLLSIAVIVALGVRLVGVLLTVALIALPSATARNVSQSMKTYTTLSFLFGILAPIFGLLIYQYTTIHHSANIPAGTLIILAGAFMFLLSIFFRKN